MATAYDWRMRQTQEALRLERLALKLGVEAAAAGKTHEGRLITIRAAHVRARAAAIRQQIEKTKDVDPATEVVEA